MHTVIILNKHSSDLLKDFKFLFQPFVDQKAISFCAWNESGTDIKTSVPDLYKLIKGKQEWRAVVIGTDSMSEQTSGPAASEKNPFDYPGEISKDEVPKESNVSFIRLSHMLCGFPVSSVKNFVKGFEYFDDETGKIRRVCESELSEEEIAHLAVRYSGSLKSIYMEEKVSEEVEKAQKELVEKYSFADIRPREMIFIATRRHFEDEEHIYASWKTQLEMESSNFCGRNNYPSICRFLCYSITNAENSRYIKELIEFWLSVLTVALNKIPASSLQAYKLYRVGVNISREEFGKLLNTHINKMEATYNFIQERLAIKPEFSFDEEDDMVEPQRVPVSFEGSSGRDLLVSTNKIGLSRDCPQDELLFWNAEMNEKRRGIDKYLKAPRRAIDKASQYLKSRTESFYGDEFELDRFQVADLKEEIEHLEAEVLENTTDRMMDDRKIKEEFKEVDKKVKKDIAVHIRKSVAITMGIVALVSFFVGFIPYLVNSAKVGKAAFSAAVGVVLLMLAVTALGGLIVLFILRYQTKMSMERFNVQVREMVSEVGASGRKFEEYFSAICTYMKAQSIYTGIRLKSDSTTSSRARLHAHKKALRMSMERDEELIAAFGIRREQEFEKNVTAFFDETKLPRDNRLYYFETNKSGVEIPLNATGDLVETPYKFIEKLEIEREDIFDETKGEGY